MMAGDPEKPGPHDLAAVRPPSGTQERSSRGTGSPSSSAGSVGETNDLRKVDSQLAKKEEPSLDELLAHLPEHEREIIKEQLEVPSVKVTYFTLYRYATTNDLIILAVSSIAAIAGGAALPFFTVRMAFLQICLMPTNFSLLDPFWRYGRDISRYSTETDFV